MIIIMMIIIIIIKPLQGFPNCTVQSWYLDLQVVSE